MRILVLLASSWYWRKSYQSFLRNLKKLGLTANSLNIFYNFDTFFDELNILNISFIMQVLPTCSWYGKIYYWRYTSFACGFYDFLSTFVVLKKKIVSTDQSFLCFITGLFAILMTHLNQFKWQYNSVFPMKRSLSTEKKENIYEVWCSFGFYSLWNLHLSMQASFFNI